MRPRRGWGALMALLVGLSLIGLIGSGCEKTGGTSSEPPPPSPTPPVQPVIDIAGITLASGEQSLFADGTSSTMITATLVNSEGNPSPDGIIVAFTTDNGRFTPDGAKSATATTRDGTGIVAVPFLSEPGVVGVATIVASANGVTSSIQIALRGPGGPASIILTVEATTIPPRGTTGITAQVLDGEGHNVADGTAVLFATNLRGTRVTPRATTVDGVASATFAAGTVAGEATVTAMADSALAQASITIQGRGGSLEFVSAVPAVIGVLGSPLPQLSTITFMVTDVSGNAVSDGTVVTFTLIGGVGGGETITPTQVGTVAGSASTVLTSGTVAGPVRVQANVTVEGITLTSSSTNISIVSGNPSAAHMGVAPAFLNVAGQVLQGIICPVTAIIGDRFGNPVTVILEEDSSGTPVLGQTPVSFYANGGVISPVGITDGLGNAPAEIKTGPPIPNVGNLFGLPLSDPRIQSDARTGFVTIMAVTQGEETFIDSNGNGIFDGPGEFDPTDPELDTPEPFLDHVTLCNGTPLPPPCPAGSTPTGDGMFDPNDRFELFIDGNGNGIWDTPNGVWDANKPIFATTRVLFSGPTQLSVGLLQPDGTCSGSPGGFTVPNGGFSSIFCILVSDPQGHPLVSGTQLSVTTTEGAISGTSSVTLPDTQQGGPGTTFFTFAVADSDAADTDQAEVATVTVSVTSASSGSCPGGNGSASVSFVGTVD